MSPEDLGVLKTFVAFVFHLLLPFMLCYFFGFCRKSTSWVRYIECGLTQVLLLGDINVFFLYCATRSSFHFPVCFTFSALNGFIIIIITRKNLLFSHAFFFLFPSIWLIKDFYELYVSLKKRWIFYPLIAMCL